MDLPYAAQQMQAVAESFEKDNKVRIRHFVVSFYRNEAIDPYKASMIACTVRFTLTEKKQASKLQSAKNSLLMRVRSSGVNSISIRKSQSW